MKIGIIGLGLIGGSIGKDVKELTLASKVIGFDSIEEHRNAALELGLVDEIVSVEKMSESADVIVIAIPVDAARKVLSNLLDIVPEKVIITDVGSSKEMIADIALKHEKGSQFVPGHPIAGTENSGPKSAISGLFKGKLGILCPTEKTDPKALKTIEKLYKDLGMHLEIMNAIEHDKHLAYVSHLSHISSFALGLTVLEIEKDEQKIFDLAGSGFESTVRLAKSAASMWGPIFKTNKENILDALGEYIEQLNTFKELFEKDNFDEVQAKMIQANEIRRVLNVEQKEIASK